MEYILSLLLIDPPGSQFLYNSGGTNVLGFELFSNTSSADSVPYDFSNSLQTEPPNIRSHDVITSLMELSFNRQQV